MPPNNGDSGSSYMELGTSMQVIKHNQLVSQGAPEKGTVKMNPPWDKSNLKPSLQKYFC